MGASRYEEKSVVKDPALYPLSPTENNDADITNDIIDLDVVLVRSAQAGADQCP